VHVVQTEPVPLKVWGEDIDEDALEQARHLARLPFAFHHVALMPDAHVGYGMPIGGVLAALGQVIPNAVGLDIGCGVRAWRTNIPADEFLDVRDQVLSDIQRSVPVGFEWHKSSQEHLTTLFDNVPDIEPLPREMEKAKKQVGSLGGGNHFIELQRDPDGVVWAMVHSGSRNVGKQVADYHNAAAKRVNASQHSPVPPEWGLAHLAADSSEGSDYLEAMNWCLRFAKENRRLMQRAVQSALDRRFPGIEPDDHVDVHHNYAAPEEHFGEEVIVHRKGAVKAEGRVVVPGSMGTASYICRGLANPDAFRSCSHGAGRTMGRKQAMREILRDDVIHELREKDIRLFKAKKKDLAEEAPEAYKDIEDVMRWQADLVEPVVRLTPLGVVKG